MLSIALCFFTMEMAAIALFPTMGNKMHTGRENSDKFWKGKFIHGWETL